MRSAARRTLCLRMSSLTFLLLGRYRKFGTLLIFAALAGGTAFAPACADAPTEQNTADLEEASFLLPEHTSADKAKDKKAPLDSPQQKRNPNDEITVTRFRKLKWSPSNGTFSSEGSLRIEYKELDSDVTTQMTAENVNYDAASGRVQAKGGVRLLRPEGFFTGREIDFNFKTASGYVTDALLDTEFFRMRGERIERKDDGTFELLKGDFTTCENERPDYRVRAGRLTVKAAPPVAGQPTRYQSVSARNITFYAGPTALISLPSYRRSLVARSRPAIPNIGFNRADGLSVRQSDSLIENPHESLYYDARINLRRLPTGFLTYQRDFGIMPKNALPPVGLINSLNDPLRGYLEQLTPPTYQEFAQNRYNEPNEPRQTFFAVLQNDLFSYTRRRTDLGVSRFPEVGVRWTNILGRRNDPNSETNVTPLERQREGTLGILRRDPSAPFLVDFIASGGLFNERPTNVTAGKLGMRLDIASQPLVIGRNLALRAAVSNQTSVYSRGTLYNLFSPEVELNYVPDRNAIFGIGYRFTEGIGRTPFAFDALDVRHELRLRAQYGGAWGFGIVTRYDLERVRAYDTEIALVRNFDCMQVGLGYRFRSQQFAIIFNLTPPLPSNRANRRLTPDVGNPNPPIQ